MTSKRYTVHVESPEHTGVTVGPPKNTLKRKLHNARAGAPLELTHNLQTMIVAFQLELVNKFFLLQTNALDSVA